MLQVLKDKWQVFKRSEELPDWEIDQLAEFEISSEKLTKNAKDLIVLKKTSGYKLLEDYWRKKIEVLRTRLEKKDDIEVRAELKVLRQTLSYIENQISYINEI